MTLRECRSLRKFALPREGDQWKLAVSQQYSYRRQFDVKLVKWLLSGMRSRLIFCTIYIVNTFIIHLISVPQVH